MSPDQWAQPTETVTASSVSAACTGAAATAARSRSAARSAPGLSVPGRIATNSSPPQRASSSPPRTAPREPARHVGQHLVAGLVPVRVVDRLEVVDVDPHEREHASVAHAERDLALELVRAVAAVRQRGQVIGQRLPREPPVGLEQRVVEPLDAQRRDHARVQLGRVERLAQEVVRAAPQRLDEQVGSVRARQHDHRHGGELFVLAQSVEQLHPAQTRQLVVQQHHVGRLAPQQRERLLGVGGAATRCPRSPSRDSRSARVVSALSATITRGGGCVAIPTSNGSYGVNLTVITSPSAIR